MPLDPEKIKQLLAKKNAPPKRRSGGGSKKVDTSVRDVATWFALPHHMMNYDTKELLRCENPNCQDPRHKGIMVVEIDTVYMCRYCFLDGWLAPNPAQEQITSDV